MSPATTNFGQPGTSPTQSHPQFIPGISPSDPTLSMGSSSETPIQRQPPSSNTPPLSPITTPIAQPPQSEFTSQSQLPPSSTLSQMMNTPYSAALPSLSMTRPQPQYPQGMNLDYTGNLPSMNMQQLQFVPCMCPVSVTISAQPLQVPIEKRSDEVTSDSMDAISIVAPPEEKQQSL